MSATLFSKLKTGLMVLAGLGLGGFLSIGLAQAQGTPPTKGDAIWPYLASLSKEQRLRVIKERATREGNVVIYGTLGIDRAQIFIDLFSKTYPGIKVDFVRLDTGSISQKVLAERQAGKIGSDIIVVSPSVLELMKAALAPYQPTSWADYDPQFLHGGTAAGWTAMDYEILPYAIAWRTDRVAAAEAPKSFDALANPKWKGRTGTVKELEPIIDGFVDMYGQGPGMDKIKGLAALSNRTYPSIGALSGALASGEIDIAWGIGAYRAAPLKASGAPVDYILEDPTFAVTDAVTVPKDAVHPYAGILMMEFLTDPAILAQLDKLEPGRLFGNLKGHYANQVTDFPHLRVFQPLPQARYTELNRLVEQLFVRQ